MNTYQDIYQEDLIEEAKNPSNLGKIEDPDIQSTQYNASCGDQVTVYLKLSHNTNTNINKDHNTDSNTDPDKNHISEIKWQGQGCVISQASMSLLSEKLKNMAVADVLKLEQKDVLDLLGFEDIAMGRVKCLMLGLTAVKKMLQNKN